MSGRIQLTSCYVCTNELKCKKLYREHWICNKCSEAWNVEYFKLHRGKYSHLGGWKNWKPIFEKWARTYVDTTREVVTFT